MPPLAPTLPASNQVFMYGDLTARYQNNCQNEEL